MNTDINFLLCRQAMRISQLESISLDVYFYSIITPLYRSIFDNFKPHVLIVFEKELILLARIIIWKFSIWRSSRTLGQEMMGVTYASFVSGDNKKIIYSPITKFQKLSILIINGFGSYVFSKIEDFKLRNHKNNIANKFLRLWNYISITLKFGTIVNFLLFLINGNYTSLTERLLRLKTVEAHNKGVVKLNYEYFNREIISKEILGFIIFFLPLIPFKRIYYQLKLLPIYNCILNKLQLNNKNLNGDEIKDICAACMLEPTLPYSIGCTHLFCYYCVYSNFLCNSYFQCPICKLKITELFNIKSICPILENL